MAAALTATATAKEAADSCAQWSKARPCVDKLKAMLDYEIRKREVILCFEGGSSVEGEGTYIHTYIYVCMFNYVYMYVYLYFFISKQHKEYNPI